MEPVLTVGIAEEVQAGLIALMKASPAMMSSVAVGADGQKEIREDDWMSRNFNYPAYRLQILNLGLSPGNNGTCATTIHVVHFSILCFAEKGSSISCLRLMDIARKEMVGKQLKTDMLTPVTSIVYPDGGMIFPVPESERTWRGEVQLVTTVKER